MKKDSWFRFWFWISIISGVLGSIILFLSQNWAGGLFALSSAVMAHTAKTYWEIVQTYRKEN